MFQEIQRLQRRASRSEFWWFFLFQIIVGLIVGWIPFLDVIISLALFLPGLAVTVRRLHDINRTGWWMLLLIFFGAPGAFFGAYGGGLLLALLGMQFGILAGFFVLTIRFLVWPSDPGPNRYGPNPLQPQQGMGGYDYYQDTGHPYYPAPPAGSYDESSYGAEAGDSLLEPAPEGRQFCTQCGMQLQPEARFCTVCGTAV